MANLNQKIQTFIENHFPDIDYSTLGSNQNSEIHKMALNYEYFVNSIEYHKIQKEINPESIKQISSGDMRGIDGFFLVMNNQFIFLPEKDSSEFYSDWKSDFDTEISKVSKIEGTFIFIQSKSSKLGLDTFRGFCDAVYDVFSQQENDLTNNPKVQTLKYVFGKICQKEHSLDLFVKICALQKDSRSISQLLALTDWEAAIKKQKKDLKSIIFNSVEIELKSGQDYQEKLESILSPNQRNYPIKQLKDRFIEISNEKAICYIGFLNLLEIKELLQDEDGELGDVFFDNIRYFEGFGASDSVNSKIYSSLNSNFDIFHLLHNGITITAHSKHFNPENGNLEIKAFSIINGCQTSNIVWEWIKDNNHTEEYLTNIRIPVKIIITSDTNLRAKITETANTQNEVKSIQLIAISDEAKALQKLFEEEIRTGDKLYYERLSNQYPDIRKSNKILTTDVFRSFYSSFGKAPHKLTVGYGNFEKDMLRRKDFLGTKNNGQSKHDIKAYFISSISFNYLDRFIRSKFPSLISLRHHILLLFFISLSKDFDANIENFKKDLPLQLFDDALELISTKSKFDRRATEICQIAVDHFNFFIDNTSGKPKVKLKSYYTEEGTTKMIRTFKENYFD